MLVVSQNDLTVVQQIPMSVVQQAQLIRINARLYNMLIILIMYQTVFKRHPPIARCL